MNIHSVALAIGTALPTISVLVYIRSILKGQTRPHRTTYLLLSMITGLSFASLLASRDTSGVWLAGVSFVQCLIVLGLALKFGMGGKDPFDVVCIGLCALGILAWLLTGESLMGLIASIVADFLAVLPTLRKVWRHPHTEVWLFYALDAIAAGFILGAGPYAVRAMIFPGYLLAINAVCAALIIGRERVRVAVKNKSA